MKFTVDPDLSPGTSVGVGDVYPVRGGRKRGCLWVVVSVYDRSQVSGEGVVVLMVDERGDVVGSATYGLRYFEELKPVGFVDGLEDLAFNVRRLP